MEISVKQRLVGAVVIVAAAVVFLPMVFDGPPPDDSATHSVPLALPSSQKSVKVDIDSGKPVGDGAANQTAGVTPQQPAAATAAPTGQSVQGPDKTVSTVADKSADTDADASAPKAAAAKAAAGVGESPLASKQGWAVQAGSFADPDHATALAKRLKVKGLSAFVQRYEDGGRTLYRVRVGPFPERIDAERQAPAVAAAAGGPTKVVPTP